MHECGGAGRRRWWLRFTCRIAAHCGRPALHRMILTFALVVGFALVVAPATARGVLLDSPQEETGMPLFPQRAGAFYSAAYGIDGARVAVYFRDREIEVPEFSGSETCGGYTLQSVEDPHFEVRYLNIEDEHVFFLWDSGSGGEAIVDLCAYIPSFAERYSFFARNFPDDLRSRLPAVITD